MAADETNNTPTESAPTPTSRVRPGDELDPANKSLIDALRLSFRILQGVMVILIGFYLFTGWNIVAEQERGIRLTFGKVRDTEPLEPGGHGSWPYPIGEFIRVRTSQQTVSVHEAFWLDLQERERGQTFAQITRTVSAGLDPRSDGSIITGDGNLAHVRIEATYEIRDPFQFAENVSESAIESLINRAVERGVVAAAAIHSFDTVYGQKDRFAQEVRREAQAVLDKMGSGITIVSVTCSDSRPPRALLENFNAVTQATTEAAQARELARSEARTRLTSTAGPRYEDLIRLIDQYEVALMNARAGLGSEDEADALLAEIDAFLESDEAAGRVAEVINEAEADRLRIETEASNAAALFEDYYAQFQQNPQLVMTRLWTEMIEDIKQHNFAVFTIPPDVDEFEVRINEDPARNRSRIQEAQRREQEEAHGDGR